MLQNLLKIKYPIFLAPMAGVSTPELAAEVSNAGGLGALGLGAASVEQARKQIQILKQQTTFPFQVNFFCHESVKSDRIIEKNWVKYCCEQFHRPDLIENFDNKFSCLYSSFKDNDDYLDLVIQEHVPIVGFHFGIPHPQQIQRLKQANIIIMASATNLGEALFLTKSGVDVIIAQGIEAGGHRGIFESTIDSAIKTLDLVCLIKEKISIPVVAAGGIMNAHHVKKCLQVGAHGVQLGTAFIQCSTSNASQDYREALFKSKITQISSVISGRPARGVINNWHLYIDLPGRPPVPSYPYAYYFTKELCKITKESKYEAFWAGTNVAEIQRIEAKDLVRQLAYSIEHE